MTRKVSTFLKPPKIT